MKRKVRQISVSIAALMAIAGLVFYAPGLCAAASTDKPTKYGGQYRVPLEGEPITLDPHRMTGIYAVNVAANLFDGLLEFDSNLNVVPGIAKFWKISRDHRTYTFKLREGVKFHNGREVKAQDFVYSYARILAPETKSSAAPLFMKIKGAEAYNHGNAGSVSGLRARGDHTLVIELVEPFAPFLSILAMANAKVIPEESVNADFGKNPVGTGPFRLGSWNAGKDIILEANADYYGGRPYLDKLRFQIYPNIEWETIFSDFEEGSLDQAFIPRSKYDVIMSNAQFKDKYSPISKPGLNLVYIGMNTSLDYFKDRRVRQAFIYAVNRTSIVTEITRRGSIQAKGILPPGIAGYDPYLQAYPYDPGKARELLASAGYPNGQGLPSIEIWTVSKSESVQKELQAYKEYMGAVGVELVPKVAANWKEFIQRINEKRAAMFYAAWYADFPDPDNFLYVLCHSKSKTNRMGYFNPIVDKMLEDARDETDYMKRVEQYRKIEKLVIEDAHVISQHVNSFNFVFQPWVKGVELNHMGASYLPFKKIWLDQQQLASHLARIK